MFFTSVRERCTGRHISLRHRDEAYDAVLRRPRPRVSTRRQQWRAVRAISVVRVERDSAQRLWRFPLDGGAPTRDSRARAARRLSRVGRRPYPRAVRAWLAEHAAARRHTNRRSRTRSRRASGGRFTAFPARIASASCARPRQRSGGSSRSIRRVARNDAARAIAGGRRGLRVAAGGSIVCGRDTQLLRWSGKAGDEWREIADLGSAGVKGITRLAVSARGDRIAFVADGRTAAQ